MGVLPNGGAKSDSKRVERIASLKLASTVQGGTSQPGKTRRKTYASDRTKRNTGNWHSLWFMQTAGLGRPGWANARHRHATGLTALLHRGTAGGRGGENEFVIVAARQNATAAPVLRQEANLGAKFGDQTRPSSLYDKRSSYQTDSGLSGYHTPEARVIIPGNAQQCSSAFTSSGGHAAAVFAVPGPRANFRRWRALQQLKRHVTRSRSSGMPDSIAHAPADPNIVTHPRAAGSAFAHAAPGQIR